MTLASRSSRAVLAIASALLLSALVSSPMVRAADDGTSTVQLAQATPDRVDAAERTAADVAHRSGSIVVSILTFLLAGLVIGALAKFLMPGPDSGGYLATTLLGIAGALVGGFLASLIGVGSMRGFSIGSLVIAVLGAMLLLLAQRMLRRAA